MSSRVVAVLPNLFTPNSLLPMMSPIVAKPPTETVATRFECRVLPLSLLHPAVSAYSPIWYPRFESSLLLPYKRLYRTAGPWPRQLYPMFEAILIPCMHLPLGSSASFPSYFTCPHHISITSCTIKPQPRMSMLVTQIFM